MAQLVAQHALNVKVVGSSPTLPTKTLKCLAGASRTWWTGLTVNEYMAGSIPAASAKHFFGRTARLGLAESIICSGRVASLHKLGSIPSRSTNHYKMGRGSGLADDPCKIVDTGSIPDVSTNYEVHGV